MVGPKQRNLKEDTVGRVSLRIYEGRGPEWVSEKTSDVELRREDFTMNKSLFGETRTGQE